MTIHEAKQSLRRWSRWASKVQSRWPAGTPLHNLAQRRVLEAQIRLLETKCDDNDDISTRGYGTVTIVMEGETSAFFE